MPKKRKPETRQISIESQLYVDVAQWCYHNDRSLPKFTEQALRNHLERETRALDAKAVTA